MTQEKDERMDVAEVKKMKEYKRKDGEGIKRWMRSERWRRGNRRVRKQSYCFLSSSYLHCSEK